MEQLRLFGGTLEIGGGVTGMFVPEPATTLAGAVGAYDGTQRIYNGFKEAFTSLRE